MNAPELPVPVLISFALAAAALATGVLAIVWWRLRDRAEMGELVHAVRPSPTSRIVGLFLLVGALVLAWQTTTPAVTSAAAALLAAGAVVVLLRPFADEQACGLDGVRRGWTRRRFDAVEEWRLTGHHLRFRVRGLWLAVELPQERHDEVEARLRAVAADRESPFK